MVQKSFRWRLTPISVFVTLRQGWRPEWPIRPASLRKRPSTSSYPKLLSSLDSSCKICISLQGIEEFLLNIILQSHNREIDGQVYKASVKEKEKAQAEYQSAVDAGQSAAQVSTRYLISQLKRVWLINTVFPCFSARDANQFTVSVNIEPKAKINFNLTYEELLTRRRGIYEHVRQIFLFFFGNSFI